MKIGFSKEEYWPVYELDNEFETIEIPDELIKRWEKVHKEFWEVQDELRHLIRKKERLL